MKKVCALLALAVALSAICSGFFLSPTVSVSVPDENELPDVISIRNSQDPWLSGSGPIDTIDGTSSDEYLFKQMVRYPDGSPKVIKTVFSNSRGLRHLHPRGHYLKYEKFRQNGTLSESVLVYPEPSLSCSVIAAASITTFEDDGTSEIETRYVREDGTTGAISNELDNSVHWYRADGLRLRSKQEYVDGDYLLTYYRLDGTTEWWSYNYAEDIGKVHFDLNGAEYEQVFKRTVICGSYSMGPTSAPITYNQDCFLGPSGKPSYRQTWTVAWDNNLDTTREILTRLEIFDETGEQVKKTLSWEPDANKPSFLKSVEEFNGDGTKTVRTYRSPNCRQSEESFDKSGKSLSHKSFPESDQYQETIDERLLHGFDHDIYGTYDDDSHDV